MNVLAEVVAPVAEATGLSAEAAIAWAIALLLLAAGLAVVEFLVVSWGMLLVGAAISALGAIALAFHADPTVGWIFVAITPVIFAVVIRLGFRVMRHNPAAILPTEITGNAGIRGVAAEAGVGLGALGELVTNAFPTGRARFSGTRGPVTLDVQVQGAVLDRGARVVVLAIDGPVITVGAARDINSAIIDNPTQQGS